WPPCATVVARVRSLHLHHVGAERGEDLGAVRARDRRRHVEHAHSREWLMLHGANHRCHDGVVFHSLVNLVSDAWWTYPLVFGVAMVDAFFPLVPGETVAITAGVLAGSGQLSLPLCIGVAALGAFVGDNVSYGLGTWLGEHTVKRLIRGEKAQRGFEWAEKMLEER